MDDVRARHLGCGVNGSGCANCAYCCFKERRGSQSLDSTAHYPPRNLTLVITWKPELQASRVEFSRARSQVHCARRCIGVSISLRVPQDAHDAAAFDRICAARPGVLMLGMGVHEAAGMMHTRVVCRRI